MTVLRSLSFIGFLLPELKVETSVVFQSECATKTDTQPAVDHLCDVSIITSGLNPRLLVGRRMPAAAAGV